MEQVYNLGFLFKHQIATMARRTFIQIHLIYHLYLFGILKKSFSLSLMPWSSPSWIWTTHSSWSYPWRPLGAVTEPECSGMYSFATIHICNTITFWDGTIFWLQFKVLTIMYKEHGIEIPLALCKALKTWLFCRIGPGWWMMDDSVFNGGRSQMFF